jgi:hypothetical protein
VLRGTVYNSSSVCSRKSFAKMHLTTLASSFALVAAALAASQPAMMAGMPLDEAFGLSKRQSGYYPSSSFCGRGDTCAEACGAGSEMCSSTDGSLHCYRPDRKQTCCPNGSGGKTSSQPRGSTTNKKLTPIQTPATMATTAVKIAAKRPTAALACVYLSHAPASTP